MNRDEGTADIGVSAEAQEGVTRSTLGAKVLTPAKTSKSRLRHAARALLLLTPLTGVNAQSVSPPTTTQAPEAGTRADLLASLRQIDAQLADLTEDGQPADVNRLLELKAQFEVLVLQAELEALRRQNAALQAQRARADGAGQATGAAQASAPQRDTPSFSGEISEMQRQFARLSEQQANVTAQLGTIERQHALLLAELGGASPSPASPAPASEGQNEDSMVQTELTALRDRFVQLDTRQEVVNTQLQTITDQHAALLAQLDPADPNPTTSPGTPQTYTVRPGDSLSELAKAFYGTGARWPDLLEANPSLTDPDQLLVGMALVIP